MINMLRTKRGEAGFTLVELLIVVAILGILAGVVVFSVAGVQNDSLANACKAEASTLRTAEEAYFVKNKTYAASSVLKTDKFLGTTPAYAEVTAANASATGYTVTWTSTGGCTGTP
jgi:prepilin-type N-terminal cleavage/methylation domain-containing protein